MSYDIFTQISLFRCSTFNRYDNQKKTSVCSIIDSISTLLICQVLYKYMYSRNKTNTWQRAMSNKSYFLFKTSDSYYLVENKDVQKVPKPREMITRAATVEAVRDYAIKNNIEIGFDKARAKSKHTEETKLKIGAGVKANHGHKNGLSESHKAKIKKTMTGTRQGYMNPMHGRKQKDSTRQKMHEAWLKRERKKWICGPAGTLLVPKSQPLPEGWQKGRKYDPYRPEDD